MKLIPDFIKKLFNPKEWDKNKVKFAQTDDIQHEASEQEEKQSPETLVKGSDEALTRMEQAKSIQPSMSPHKRKKLFGNSDK